MRHASRARMKKRLKYYLIDGANVCVCVCVTLFSGVCKYKALKDAEKHTFLCTAFIGLWFPFLCIVPAKVNKVCETRKYFLKKYFALNRNKLLRDKINVT